MHLLGCAWNEREYPKAALRPLDASTLNQLRLTERTPDPKSIRARVVFWSEAVSLIPSQRPQVAFRDLLSGWRTILAGRPPMLSIEITRECPLNCPGCYAYGANHLGGGITLSQLRDFRGDALVEGVLELIRKYHPIHISLVGGEPMIRHRELARILPALGRMGVHTLLVTSGVIRIPKEWIGIPRFRVAVSVDGLPEHHNVRRKP